MIKKIKSLFKKFPIKGEQLVAPCFVLALIGMTYGFAHYSQLIQIQGVSFVKSQGIVRFTELTLIDSTNVDANYPPSFTDDTLDFNLHFVENDASLPYSATYQITVQNDTFYNQTFQGIDFNPIIRNSGGVQVDSSSFNITLNGLSEGDMIASESSLTFTVTLTFTPSSGGSYTVDGEATVETEEEPDTGRIIATLSGSTTGNLRDSNIRAPFTASVINTHNTTQAFSLLISNTSHYKLVDSSGNSLAPFTIASGATQSYTFYVERLSGAIFTSDQESTLISLLTTSNERTNVGTVTLLVDDSTYYDTTAPTISGVTLTMIRSAEGQALVTWSGADDVAPTGYTVEIYNSSNSRVGNPHNTAGDETTMTITGLGTGTYYAKVYGRDAEDNTATSSEITNCPTSAGGHCMRSSNVSMKWRYNVTNNLTNLSSNGASTALIDSTYTATLSPSSNKKLPDSITVAMGGSTLSSGSGYSYNSSSGQVQVYNVSGDITITATAKNGCLIEGTMIKLANGSEKAIENITYDDELLVWSYETGKVTTRKPVWIEKRAKTSSYQLSEFSDGTKLKTATGHGVFSVELNRFVSVDNTEEYYVGMHIYKLNRKQQLEAVEVTNITTVYETVNYYHVVSTDYYNIFANNILTTDDAVILSNLYGFDEQVKWPASRAEIIGDKNNLYNYADFTFMPKWMFDGLRVQEGKYLDQIGILPKEEFIKYLKENQLNPDLYLPKQNSFQFLDLF